MRDYSDEETEVFSEVLEDIRANFNPSDNSLLDTNQLKEYHEFIFFTVKERLKLEPEKFEDFVTQSRGFGQGELTAPEYWAFLVYYFGESGAVYFMPKIARMIRDDDKREELQNAPEALAEMGVDAAEMKALSEKFKLHSSRKSKSQAPQIFKKDFRKAVRVLAYSIPDHEYEPPGDRDLNVIWKTADVDNSKSVDFQEFVMLYTRVKNTI